MARPVAATRSTNRPSGHRKPGKPRRAAHGSAAITLLYLRPDGVETDLDLRLAEVARRYASVAELRIVRHDQAGHLAAWAPPGAPALLVLRRGAVIGEAMGDLPVRELDQAVRRAVEWPAAG